VALAEGVSGSVESFVDLMNKQAQAWGLKNSHFTNVTGLTDPGHKMSPRDIAFVSAKLIKDHPAYYPYYAIRQYTYNHIKQDNRNMLLGRDPSVDGLKTGYTEAAGYCQATSAVRDMPNGKRRLIAVVMGAASRQARASESQKLLNWGWSAWDDIRLFDADKAVATVPVWKGSKADARLGASGPIYVTVPKGEGDKLKTSIERTDPLVAPLTKGQRVGTLHVTTAGGAKVADVPLVVMEPVALAGLFGRAWDALRLWIK
jgi:D-alanyl-D-alanine carboxypeptidase (penicillin-binding protein 5/6)